MEATRSSSSTKRELLRVLLVDGLQTAKMVVDAGTIGPDHGFPDSIIDRYPKGIPLDLNPRWPLNVDLDSESGYLHLSLSFDGDVCRCRIPWASISVLGVGFGGVAWEHEQIEEPLPPDPTDRPRLRLVT